MIRTAMLACMLLVGGVALSAETGNTSPRGHAYYENDRIKSLSLEQLQFKEVRRTRVDGVEVIIGTYSGFDQPLALADGSTQTVRWRQGAALFLPPPQQWERRDVRSKSKGLLYNGHFVFSDKIDGFTPTDKSVWGFELNQAWGVGVAKAFGIPVLIHGYEPEVVKQIEGGLYHGLQAVEFQRLLDQRITDADAMPLDGRYLINGWPLAKGDMVSITLLQRLVERERGERIEQVASVGISKEGGSHWILGAADDRVSVLAPGGSYHEDWSDLLDRYRKDWNGDTASAGFPAELDGLLKSAWRLGDWLTNTPAGQKVDRLISPTHWIEDIHARHILVSEDLGSPAQHDRIWPLLGENRFLSRLAAKHDSVRFVRVFDGSGLTLSDDAGEMGRSLLPQAADLLVNDAVTPSTPRVGVKSDGRRLQFTASSTIGAGSPVEAVLLYAISPERTLRRPDVKWEIVPMPATAGRNGEFVSPWLAAIPSGQGITYMVVVREKVVRPPLTYWRSATSLPAEHFAVPEFSGTLPAWNSGGKE